MFNFLKSKPQKMDSIEEIQEKELNKLCEFIKQNDDINNILPYDNYIIGEITKYDFVSDMYQLIHFILYDYIRKNRTISSYGIWFDTEFLNKLIPDDSIIINRLIMVTEDILLDKIKLVEEEKIIKKKREQDLKEFMQKYISPATLEIKNEN